MKHLRRAGTSIVVALFTAGLLTVTATSANAADEDGAQAFKKNNSTSVTTFRRDTSWP